MNFLIKTFEKTKRFGRNLFNIDNEDKYYTNNPSQEYLFMGGCKNGLYMSIPDNKWQILVSPNICCSSKSEEIYNKIILSTPKTRLAVYISEGFSERDILDKLTESYRKK